MSTTTPRGGGRGREPLAGRYELRGLVGQGGMADVELAHDRILDRDVAVKILHARYADDPSFLARFRREAQAAASLNHPNIVGVYDTGEDDGRPFIVMELVRGQSLRDLLRSEEVQPQRAIQMTGDAALGLHYAHERGLVHRDIKPGNILVSEERQVKVADFGIARAVNAENVTQTAAVFGTAAYVAPEQAQGEEVDRRTDVYSLGCVLYELLTGRQPFAADSAVALAYKHVSEAPIPPSRINRELSPALDAVVMKAMAKDPAARYQTAREFQQDLQRAARGEAVLAPSAAAYAATQVVARQVDRTVVAPVEETVVRAATREETVVEEEPERSNRAVWWILATVLVLALIAAAAFFASDIFGGADDADPQPSPSPSTAPLPNVVGQDINAATEALRAAGFDPVLGEQRPDPEAPVNQVIETDPPPDAPVPAGATITLIYSAGPPQTTVPQVAGQPQDTIVAALQEAGLVLGEVVPQNSDEVEADLVIGSDPEAGTEVDVNTPVDFFVSIGDGLITVPDITGLTLEEARIELDEACGEPPCFVPVVPQDEFSDEAPAGEVIRTEPAPDTEVEPGNAIVVVVSQGPEETEPPVVETPEPEPTPSEDVVVPGPDPEPDPVPIPTALPTVPARVTPTPVDPGEPPPPIPDGG